MDEMLIKEFKYNKETAAAVLSPKMFLVVNKHAEMFGDRIDFPMKEFDSVWEELCKAAHVKDADKFEAEQLIFAKGIYEISLKMNEDEHKLYLQASKEIEEMAMVAMG